MKFTRAFCNDRALEDVGISSEPNVLSYDLNENDDTLIIASGAVFEFLTNQEIIKICGACRDPLQASEAVTKAAYEKWIENTNRCDDITVIVCFLSDFSHSLQTTNRISSDAHDVHVMVDDDDFE
jgi:serine/threonine protein phosphatase PrpC